MARPRIGDTVIYRLAAGEVALDAPPEARLHRAEVLAVPNGEGEHPHIALAAEVQGEEQTHLDICHKGDVGDDFPCWDWPH